MSRPVDVGEQVAALHFYLATALRRDDDMGRTLSAIPQHRDALLGSAQDDAWVWALNNQQKGEAS